MEFKNIKKIEEILKQKNRKNIQKILLILILINLIIFLIFIFTDLFLINKIIKTIINCLIGIVDTILIVLMLKKEEVQNTDEEIELEINEAYDPIILQFFQKNKIIADSNLILAECESLIQRELMEVEKRENETIFKIKKDMFIRMNGVEGVEESKIDEYSKNGIPAYENLFVTKILFPFENEISLKELIKKAKEGYYQQREEMCELLLEKMLLHKIENEHLVQDKKQLTFSIILIINIIVSFLTWMGLGAFNIVLLLGSVVNIGISAMLLKNEKMFAYNFNPEILEYMDKIHKYTKKLNLEDEGITRKDIMLKMFFGEIQVDETIGRYF